jgi:hypothetical protein
MIELGIFIILVAIIPFLPDTVLELFDHPAFRVLLILLVLFALSQSTYIGILTLLVLGAVLIQRNYRKMKGIVYVKTDTSSMPRMKEDEEMPVSASMHYVPDNEPERDVVYFTPMNETGSDEFSPAPGATSIDRKFVPAAMPTNKSIF